MPSIISAEFLTKIRTFINNPQKIQEKSIQMVEICRKSHN